MHALRYPLVFASVGIATKIGWTKERKSSHVADVGTFVDLKQLRTFVQIAEVGTLTKAADRLHTAQPALSRQIRLLEEDLGVNLFERHGRGMVLTVAGQKLLERARVILRYIADTSMEVGSLTGALVGEITLGMPPSFAETYGTALIDEFLRRYPDVFFRVESALSGHLLEKLQRGEVDLAFLYNPSTIENLLVQPILSENLCLIGTTYPGVRAETSVGFDLLNGLPLVVPGRLHGLRQLLDSRAESLGFALNIILEIDCLRLQIELPTKGVCYSVMPRFAVRREIENGELFAWEIVEPHVNRRLVLAAQGSRPLTSAAHALWHDLPDILAPMLG
jgi:LysR family transcriptional regulator, nitrogen assimilation regulatory protein